MLDRNKVLIKLKSFVRNNDIPFQTTDINRVNFSWSLYILDELSSPSPFNLVMGKDLRWPSLTFLNLQMTFNDLPWPSQTQAQNNSHSIPRLYPIDSKSSLSLIFAGRHCSSQAIVLLKTKYLMMIANIFANWPLQV